MKFAAVFIMAVSLTLAVPLDQVNSSDVVAVQPINPDTKGLDKRRPEPRSSKSKGSSRGSRSGSGSGSGSKSTSGKLCTDDGKLGVCDWIWRCDVIGDGSDKSFSWSCVF
ncbi:hypothetical protein MCOR25_002489 [Pyricularia grisea]|nr:hypothetical protein MCOR25_002489 [Pyricularia grisea]